MKGVPNERVAAGVAGPRPPRLGGRSMGLAPASFGAMPTDVPVCLREAGLKNRPMRRACLGRKLQRSLGCLMRACAKSSFF